MTATLTRQLWAALGGNDADIDQLVTVSGPARVLPSIYDVTGFAAASVAAASLAISMVDAIRSGTEARAVAVDRRAASAAFLCEALFTPSGWQRSPVWDPIAGDYPTADGWIRLHTNYSYHRDAVERVLGLVRDREQAAREVQRWSADDLESAVVEAGGCAAAQHERSHWLASPAGSAAAGEPLVDAEIRPAGECGSRLRSAGTAPLAGVRVLDLTRVIAGPVATRVLAAYGADVLRIDPPGFQEVSALLPETTAGKRCAALDLRARGDLDIFRGLLRHADILVCGLRGSALDRLGLTEAALVEMNPALITARIDAYGWSGPWVGRRGFDSLVQMSCGIAAAGAMATGQEKPRPLPAQALDHGTGWILAAAIARALGHRLASGEPSSIRCSLAATANVLMQSPVPDGLDSPAPSWSANDTEPTSTFWGPARRVPVPGQIAGLAAVLGAPSGPLGRHEPRWLPA